MERNENGYIVDFIFNSYHIVHCIRPLKKQSKY